MKPVLSALGLVNALGNNKSEVLGNFLAGISPGMQQDNDWIAERNLWVGKVTGTLPCVPEHLSMFDCRNNQLLLAALSQIKQEIDDAVAAFGRERIAVVIGSSTSGIAEGEAAIAYKMHDGKWPDGFDYRQQEIGSPSEFVARFLDISGIAYTVSTACSSSAKVFSSARHLLEMDLCDAVICGGSDSLCQLTLNGFSALEALSADRCEPFAENRSGINIGEGAALFLMMRNSVGAIHDSPLQQSPLQDIRLAGVGESADAHHISAPHPEGIGAESAMQNALSDAKIGATDISYINLHGTATPLNDAMESAAVFRVFGNGTSCSSTKPLTGHTLGAAGATEVALCWLLLSAHNINRELPPQLNSALPDPSLAPVALLREKNFLPDDGVVRALSNSFAFGGSNATVILETGKVRDLEKLLPHRLPMLLLTKAVDYDDSFASAIVHISDSSAFFDVALGGVPSWVGMEYMAQTIGIWAGNRQLSQGIPVQPGFLLGCRRFECNAAVFPVGSTLSLSARLAYYDDNGLGAFDCLIEAPGIQASAQIKAFLPGNPRDFVRPFSTLASPFSTNHTGNPA